MGKPEAAVDWNELDGQLTYPPGSRVLYARDDHYGGDFERGPVWRVDQLVELPDGSVLVVRVTADRYPADELAHAPSHVVERLRQLGKVR